VPKTKNKASKSVNVLTYLNSFKVVLTVSQPFTVKN